MRRKLSKGILLIQKFAEKYTNAILQKLNITSKKTIDKKKKKKRKNQKIKKNKIFEIIENNKKKNEEYKEQKKKKLDDYLMNQEKELDFQQNYSFCNKIFFNEKDNFFCSSDEEKVTNILDTDLLVKGEENNEEQNGNMCIGNETSSLNPFHFKFYLENEKNKNENLFFFQNDDHIDKQKKKLLHKEKEKDRNVSELESYPDSYYLNLAEKKNNNFPSSIKFIEGQDRVYENEMFSNNNISYNANVLEENRKQELEKNKKKRKSEFDISFEKNKKVDVLMNKNCLGDIEKNIFSEHEKLHQIMENNAVRSIDNVCNANKSSFRINDTSEQKTKKEKNDKQNISIMSNVKHSLVFGNCTFENLKETHKKNGFEQEKVKIQQQETEKENKENINKENGTQLKDHEQEENKNGENHDTQVSHNNSSSIIYSLNNVHVINNVETQNFNSNTVMDDEYIFENEWIIHKVDNNKDTLIHKNITDETFFQQDKNENLSHRNNIIHNIGNDLDKNTTKSVDASQEPIIKDYKDDYDLFDDLNGDNSFDIFFNDLQDPPSIFKT